MQKYLKQGLIKDGLVWGFLLWLLGYLLGIALFMIVPPSLIGWFITPVGIIISLWVLFKKIQSKSLNYYFKIAVIWTIIAIVFDYLFLVKLLNPQDGYYKTDVYLYYLSTFVLPLLAGWMKNENTKKRI